MTPQERLFALEIEYHRRLWQACSGHDDPSGLHTSWAIGMGYEKLIAQAPTLKANDVVQLAQRMMLAGDVRDVLAARDSVTRFLGIDSPC